MSNPFKDLLNKAIHPKSSPKEDETDECSQDGHCSETCKNPHNSEDDEKSPRDESHESQI